MAYTRRRTTVPANNLALGYFLVAAASAVLYVASSAPGVLWQDSGLYQYRIWHGDIQGALGLALAHPLYQIIGIAVKHIPLGEFAYRVNLISAFATAFAVANLFLLVRIWLGKTLPALLAAVTFAFCWTTWQFATIAEVYNLWTALFFAELIVLVQYCRTRRIGSLYLLALLNGLAIANHMWAIIPFVCYVVFLFVLSAKKQIRFRHLGMMALLWVIGATPLEYLIVKNIVQTGEPAAVLASALFGESWRGSVLNTAVSSRMIKENLLLMAYNFSTPNVIFFFPGLLALRRFSPSRSMANLVWAMLILFFIFAFRYNVPDRYAFFIPFYCLVCLLIGLGFHRVVAGRRKIVTRAAFAVAFLPIPIYTLAPIIAEKVEFRLPTKREIPYRNDYIWFLRPWHRGCDGPQRFAAAVFETAEENAVIYADSTTVYPLLYAQEVEDRRPDLRIVSPHPNRPIPVVFNEETVPELLAETSVYVVSPVPGYCPQFLLDNNYLFFKKGPVWKVIK